MILVNADGMVLGRLASFAAKKALQKEQVVVVNAEKAVITGSKEDAMRRFQRKIGLHAKGNPRKGPKYSRMPDRILRKAVSGMLPRKTMRGREALRNVKVFISLPAEFEGKQFTEVPSAKANLEKRLVRLGEVCKLLGAKW